LKNFYNKQAASVNQGEIMEKFKMESNFTFADVGGNAEIVKELK